MRNVFVFLAVSSLVSGIAAGVGCSSNSSGGTGGTTTSTHAATSSHSSASTTSSSSTSSSSGAGGSGGSTGAGGAPTNPFECTVPAAPPSKGSCVTYVSSDGGAEVDAGVNDAGDPSITNCDPVTNAGCTGTDVCLPDFNSATNMNYFCQAGGSPAAVCGDCTNANCGPGALCVGLNQAQTVAVCVQMCCTDADCGSGKCNMAALGSPLPSNVGTCTTM